MSTQHSSGDSIILLGYVGITFISGSSAKDQLQGIQEFAFIENISGNFPMLQEKSLSKDKGSSASLPRTPCQGSSHEDSDGSRKYVNYTN